LTAGLVGKPHGLAGEVYVTPISDDPSRWQPGSELARETGDELVVEASRPHGRRLLVKFEGIDSRPDAERCRGPLYVAPKQLRALDHDEFWEHDLIGCEVVDVSGRHLGQVDRVVPGAAQDLLAVTVAAGERLVPVVKEIVVEVDAAAGRVTIDPPAGLLE